jgi:hypothetical protein
MRSLLTLVLAIPMICFSQTAQNYATQISYYRQQEIKYSQEAALEKIEIARRESINAGLYHKYPTPVNSAKNLYDSYIYKMNEANKKVKYYENLQK